MHPALRSAALDALAVLLPVDCAGCEAPDRAVCEACAGELAPEPFSLELSGTPGAPGLTVWAALRYEGVARRVLLAVKDGGRTDAARPLGRALAAAIAAAAADVPATLRGRVELAVIPSTRAAFRARGYLPLGLILAKAGLRGSRVLKLARQIRDQAGLGRAERIGNRAGSLRAARAARGRVFLLVDDIVTTGTTLREAQRALLGAGAIVVGAAAAAYTLPGRRTADAARNSWKNNGDIDSHRG